MTLENMKTLVEIRDASQALADFVMGKWASPVDSDGIIITFDKV